MNLIHKYTNHIVKNQHDVVGDGGDAEVKQQRDQADQIHNGKYPVV